ncbi:hypothetical protein GOEFS_092_00150 [Gordonia effusa NBRC 100432]|uniref:DUF3068 domain-containing protein n=1 Tax=Gordonia effusa NBRC 100432 TaxID=1077974 RepID=H0R3D9_9ACTN|nr:DUF3068 domain-containing protein [Gordonia effusa]GAB19590.1 hypothetical protein GOEFS_092_00150 [Gordonia effusa NBRC 100432]
MKRVWSALPAFFGVACIMAAIATAFYLVPQLRVVPLDLDITSDAQTVAADGTSNNRYPAVIFDRCSVTQRKARQLDANLVQQRRSVIVDPSDKRQATVQSAQSVVIERTRDASGKEATPTVGAANAERTCDDGLLTASIDRVSVNRKTSVPNGTIASIQLEAVPEGASVKDVSVDAPRQGFQYKFGFDVKKRDYLYYDLNTRSDNAAKFVGEKVIKGVTTYEFVSEVPETDLSGLANAQGEAALGTMLTMPASWWGITGRDVKPKDSVTLHRYAKATRHVFVEPKTGTIVDGREDQHQYFMSPDQSEDTPESVRNFRLDALKGTFQWDDATVARQTDKASGYVNQLKWGGVFLPIILAVVGVLLIGLWLLLFLRGRRKDRGDDGQDQPYSPAPEGAAFAAGGVSLDKPDEQPTTVLPTDHGSSPYTSSVTESGRHQRIDDAGWAPFADQQPPSGPYRTDPYDPYAGTQVQGTEPWAREPAPYQAPGAPYPVDNQGTQQEYGSDPSRTEPIEQGSNVAPTNRHARPDDDDTAAIPPADGYQGRHSGDYGSTTPTYFGSDDESNGPAVRRHVDPDDQSH